MVGDAPERAVVLSGRRVRLIGEFDFDALDASVIAFLVGRAQAVSGDPQRFLLVGAGVQVGRILELTGITGAEWVGGHDELSARRVQRAPPAVTEKAAAR